MKKRLLALALCLVLAVSLLPLTAAAAYTPDDMMGWINGIKNNGIYCKEASFTINCPQDYSDPVVVSSGPIGYSTQLNPVDGQYKITGPSDSIIVDIHFGKWKISYIITIKSDHNWDDWAPNGDGTHSRTCGNGCVDSPQTKDCADKDSDHKCDDCGASVHTWQFKAAGNTLTGYCGGANCDIKEIVLTLKADSVTLPKSPFETADLVGWNAFTDAIPSAYYNSFDYKLNGEDVTDKSNPKAGNYQVGVRIYGLPSPVEYSGVAARANTDDNGNSAYLYTQYTAADPKVTAQTGDDRPIEIMLVSALAFSALAAAAFIVDSKRRSQQ